MGSGSACIPDQYGCLCRARPGLVISIGCVESPTVSPMEPFVELHKIDAFLGTLLELQALRARKITGHVIVNSSLDRSWSQHFCCMLTGNRDFRPQEPGGAIRN